MKKKLTVLFMALPILIIVCSNTVYNIATKSAPKQINSFAMLSVVYLIASIMATLIFIILSKGNIKTVCTEYRKNNWTVILLSVSILCLEFGYLLAFKRGWKISQCSVLCNIILAIVLVFVGIILYKEKISVNQIVGMGICIAGLIVMNKHK